MHAGSPPPAPPWDATCPFFRASTTAVGAPQCCAPGSPIPLSRHYAAAYCLTARHTNCAYFVGSTPGGTDATVQRRHVALPLQHAAAALLAGVTSCATATATVAQAWQNRLQPSATAVPQPPPAPVPPAVPEARQQAPSREMAQLLERLHARSRADHREGSPACACAEPSRLSAWGANDEQGAGMSQDRATVRTQAAPLQQGHCEHEALVRHQQDARDAPAPPRRPLARELAPALVVPAVGSLQGSASASGAGAQLVLEERHRGGQGRRTAFALRPGAVVGRLPHSDIALPDPFTSAEHARLTLHEGRWWITDLGSTNGTFVNGVRIEQRQPLAAGDEIRFGSVRTRFTVASPDDRAADLVVGCKVEQAAGDGRV